MCSQLASSHLAAKVCCFTVVFLALLVLTPETAVLNVWAKDRSCACCSALVLLFWKVTLAAALKLTRPKKLAPPPPPASVCVPLVPWEDEPELSRRECCLTADSRCERVSENSKVSETVSWRAQELPLPWMSKSFCTDTVRSTGSSISLVSTL